MEIDELFIKEDEIRTVRKIKRALAFKLKKRKKIHLNLLFFNIGRPYVFSKYFLNGKIDCEYDNYKSADKLIDSLFPWGHNDYDIVKIDDDNYDVYKKSKMIIEDARHEFSKTFESDNEMDLYVDKLKLSNSKFINLCI